MSVSGSNSRTIINNYYGAGPNTQDLGATFVRQGGRGNIVRDTRGDDMLRGTDDMDVFTHKGGNDTIDGGKGFDSLKLPGRPEEYSIKQNRDGSYSIRDNVTGDVINAKNLENLSFSNGQDVALNNTQRGTRGDDMFEQASGKSTIDGGRGNDTLNLSGNREDYSIRQARDGSYVIRDKATGDVVKARSIENLKFADGESLALNTGRSGRDYYASNNDFGNYGYNRYGDHG